MGRFQHVDILCDTWRYDMVQFNRELWRYTPATSGLLFYYQNGYKIYNDFTKILPILR